LGYDSQASGIEDYQQAAREHTADQCGSYPNRLDARSNLLNKLIQQSRNLSLLFTGHITATHPCAFMEHCSSCLDLILRFPLFFGWDG
jgi:hypothetical protein